MSPTRIVPISRVMLYSANIPERYWGASIRRIAGAPAFLAQLRHYLVNIHIYHQSGKGIYLFGTFSTGKTSIGVALLKEVMRRGGTAYFLSARNILRAAYDKDQTLDGDSFVRDRIREVDMLLLDDLGTEGFDSARPGGAVLEGVFRDRYDRALPTVVTSQHAPSSLGATYPRAIANIISRTMASLSIETDQWKDKK